MRQLKFHDRKLLKKVDFLQWKSENNHRELEVYSVASVKSGTPAMSGGSTHHISVTVRADHAQVSHTGTRRLQKVQQTVWDGDKTCSLPEEA